LYTRLSKSFREVAHLMDVGKSSVHRWVRQHPATRPNRPSARKVTTVVTEAIRKHLATNPFLTASQLVQHVMADCNVVLSKHTIPSCLRRIKYSRKRTYTRAPDTTNIAERRREFQNIVLNDPCNPGSRIPPEDVISVDESGFYLHMKPGYGYAPRGKRIAVPLHRNRMSRVTLILAVSTSGIQHWVVLAGSANSTSFARFVNDLATLPHHRYLLMDNVAFHASKITRDALVARRLMPLFNAPYTPEWNPVEYVFAKVKAIYRRSSVSDHDTAISHACVEHRIEGALESLTESDLVNCFRHCWTSICDGKVDTFVREADDGAMKPA
jgi:transposase